MNALCEVKCKSRNKMSRLQCVIASAKELPVASIAAASLLQVEATGGASSARDVPTLFIANQQKALVSNWLSTAEALT